MEREEEEVKRYTIRTHNAHRSDELDRTEVEIDSRRGWVTGGKKDRMFDEQFASVCVC